jgi:3-isopropylmalate/(R)-2-methylmalate dehydratase large subunit
VIESSWPRASRRSTARTAQNIGLLTTTDFTVLARLEAGETVSIDAFTEGLDAISADIVRAGGLFAYNQKRASRGSSRRRPSRHRRGR